MAEPTAMVLAEPRPFQGQGPGQEHFKRVVAGQKGSRRGVLLSGLVNSSCLLSSTSSTLSPLHFSFLSSINISVRSDLTRQLPRRPSSSVLPKLSQRPLTFPPEPRAYIAWPTVRTRDSRPPICLLPTFPFRLALSLAALGPRRSRLRGAHHTKKDPTPFQSSPIQPRDPLSIIDFSPTLAQRLSSRLGTLCHDLCHLKAVFPALVGRRASAYCPIHSHVVPPCSPPLLGASVSLGKQEARNKKQETSLCKCCMAGLPLPLSLFFACSPRADGAFCSLLRLAICKQCSASGELVTCAGIWDELADVGMGQLDLYVVCLRSPPPQRVSGTCAALGWAKGAGGPGPSHPGRTHYSSYSATAPLNGPLCCPRAHPLHPSLQSCSADGMLDYLECLGCSLRAVSASLQQPIHQMIDPRQSCSQSSSILRYHPSCQHPTPS
ncbi:hypothetical protein BD289DRAFT_124677 [Coniella lustricola]|uniref:Uncharacterized protein n=1 Tax=Coniella lustricola TaxID=2025994 RepID=A0A2T3AFU6_9PEZI|nr:hypothetical protein BD289DRAFT_124677 [Coniella lustricola]